MSRVLPILFNIDMVQAILREVNPKTTTRRTIKGYIPNDAVFGYSALTPKGYISCRGTFSNGYGEKFFKLPCQRGDILYVRETWNKLPHSGEYIYKADDCGSNNIPKGEIWHIKWHPSIHMPKEAARIWLKVTNVRVERLRDMKPEDIRKEGMCLIITPNECKSQFDKIGAIHFYEEARKKFSELWNSTIKKSDLDLYGWDANPWVWVIEFQRCEKPESE